MDAPETSIYNAIIVTFVIFGTIVMLLILSMIKQHRRNIEMYKSKISAEINTLENERKRVAADLHDDLGPMLSAIKFKLSSIDTNEDDQQLLNESEEYIDDVIQKLRQISNDMMPATLLRKGLAFAIEEFIDRMKGINKLKISFRHNELPPLPHDVCINTYRIILEIIHNAVKHSEATDLTISLMAENQKIRIKTEDNGKGFDISNANRNYKGLGLRNILSRTEHLGGDMYVESEPGGGTSYGINIPYKLNRA